jgi:hypothetical protein
LQRKIGRPACERSKTIDDFGSCQDDPGAKRPGKSFVPHVFRAMMHHAVRWGPLLYAVSIHLSSSFRNQRTQKGQRAGLLLR